MAVFAGTNIVNDGLVFHFDLQNSVKSWKGKPTSNIVNSQTIGGVSPISLTKVGSEYGWDKYSIQGTWNRGTYPWGMRIGSTSLAGGVYHSARMLIKTNCRSKFATWVDNGGLHYVNESGMPSAGTKVATSLGYDEEGLEIFEVKNNGFQYSTTYANPTTTQVGYFHSRPASDGTTFDPQTDFVWVKEIQVEVGEFATKYVNGVRLDTASIIDVSGNNRTITASNLTYRQDDTPTFDGTDDFISLDYGANLTPYQNPMTVSCWVKPERVDLNQIFLSTGQTRGNADNNQRLYFALYLGGWNLGIQNSSWGVFYKAAEVGKYDNLVITFNNGIATFYINGLSYTTRNFNSSYTLNDNFRVGIHDSNYDFTGEIDQVKIYNRALTETEVKQNFEATRSRYGI